MIIQCPSCDTKFSVDSSQLADVENPRFHCSRCDHFFESKLSASSKPSAASETRALPKADTNVYERESEERAEDFEDLHDIDAGTSQEESSPTGHQLNLLDSEFVPDFDDDFLDQSNEEGSVQSDTDKTNIRRSAFRPELDVDDGLGMDEDFQSLARPDLESDTQNEPGRGAQSTGRLGIRHEIDIEDAPGVRVSWPEQSAGQVFEADLRRVHSQLVRSVKSAASQSLESGSSSNPLPQASPRRSSNADAPTGSNFRVGGLFHQDSDFGTSDIVENVEDDEAPQTSASDESLAALVSPPVSPPRTAATKIERFSDFDHRPIEVHSSLAAAPASAPPAPERPSHLAPESALDALLPANAAYLDASVADVALDEEEPADFSPLVSRPEDIWRDSGSKTTYTRPAPKVRTAKVSRIKSYAKGLSQFGVAVCGSVPLALTFGAWWWSGHLTQTPDFLKKYFYIEATGLSQLAPPGLEVKDLRSAFVTLDDGSQVLDIQGNIQNGSSATIGRVKIEAKIFDKENNEVGRLLVDSHLGLAEANIQALSGKALKALQQESANSFIRLNPNDSAHFRVVFTDLGNAANGKNIQWFSTRIYSIEPLTS